MRKVQNLYIVTPHSSVNNSYRQQKVDEVTHRPGSRHWTWWSCRSSCSCRCDASREPSESHWTATRRRVSCQVLRRASGSSVLQVTFDWPGSETTSSLGRAPFILPLRAAVHHWGVNAVYMKDFGFAQRKLRMLVQLRKKYHLSVSFIYNISLDIARRIARHSRQSRHASGAATYRPSATKPSITCDPSSRSAFSFEITKIPWKRGAYVVRVDRKSMWIWRPHLSLGEIFRIIVPDVSDVWIINADYLRKYNSGPISKYDIISMFQFNIIFIIKNYIYFKKVEYRDLITLLFPTSTEIFGVLYF